MATDPKMKFPEIRITIGLKSDRGAWLRSQLPAGLNGY
jgi:hypothetical protein